MAEYESTNLFGETELVSDGVKIELFSHEDIIDTALKDFRALGFPYPSLPIFECKLQLNALANLPQSKCLHNNLAYRVADTYNRHRFHSSAINMSSPFTSFNDDKRLRKVLERQYEDKKSFEYGYLGFLSLVNGTQACSNFRPSFAKMLYNKYSPKEGIVFDSSTGYGGRLVGFLASHCSEYHGTDPNTLTYKANTRLAEDLAGNKKVNLYNFPIEDLNIDHIIGKCDFSFTSPPYFIKEQYSDEDTQSCVRYPGYEDWLNGFLRPMLKKTFDVLKPGSNSLVNIESVKIKGKFFELVQPTIDIGKEVGFEHLGNDVFPLQARTKMVDGVKVVEQGNETVIIFKKPL